MGKAWALLAMVLVAVVGSHGAVGAKDDLVQHTFRCPGAVDYRINWQDKISSDPTFTVGSSAEKETHRASLRLMERRGQEIVCRYFTTPTISATYHYRVERQIISCRSAGSGVMQCDLKP